MSTDVDLPDKLTFKRKEVIKYTKLDGKVLDYWQREFGGFSPTINIDGEEFYSRKDIEFIFQLKQWMIVEKIGKEKVREKIKSLIVEKADNNSESLEIETISPEDKIKKIRDSLEEILTMLEKNVIN